MLRAKPLVGGVVKVGEDYPVVANPTAFAGRLATS